MDSCCATLKGNAHLVKASKKGFSKRGTGLWGESVRGSLKGRDLSGQLLKSLKTESRPPKLAPGVAYSVLTSNINAETVVSNSDISAILPIFNTGAFSNECGYVTTY